MKAEERIQEILDNVNVAEHFLWFVKHSAPQKSSEILARFKTQNKILTFNECSERDLLVLSIDGEEIVGINRLKV